MTLDLQNQLKSFGKMKKSSRKLPREKKDWPRLKIPREAISKSANAYLN